MGLRTSINWADGIVMESGSLRARSRYGSSPTPSGLWALTDGPGAGQANDCYEYAFSILTGATLSIDLKGGGGEVNVLNQALAFTKVKGVEVVLATAPAAGVSVRLGPQGVTNAAQLWFQAATTNFWVEVRDRFAMLDSHTGWAIGASTKILPIHNPGAGTVAGWVRVIGVR